MSTAPTPTPPSPERAPDWARIQRVSLICAAVGAAAFFIFAFTPVAGAHPLTQAFISYSVAFHFWFAITLGAQVILMIQYCTGGAWGVAMRPVLEPISRMLWLVAIFFIPVAVSFFLGNASPYPWARPLEYTARDEALQELRDKTGWLLYPGFVLLRAAIYWAIWLTLGYLLRRWSRLWRNGDPVAGKLLPAVSGPTLVLYAASITFASIDWVMMLEPFWISTMYPPIYAVGQLMAGFAFTALAVVFLSQYPPLAGRIRHKHLRDFGGLLLMWVMLWAYLSFSQFLLVWAGNLTSEITYYLKRMSEGWSTVSVGLIALQFGLPFFLLLFRDIKEHPNSLCIVAAFVLAMRFIDTMWWIEPVFPHEEASAYWLMDVAALFGLGGVWVWCLASALQRTSLEPVHGPNQCEPGGEHD